MKITTFNLFCSAVFLLSISACHKNTEEPLSAEREKAISYATTKINQSDTVISTYLDHLDNPNTSKPILIQTLCHDFPNEYKNNYMPALLELETKEFSSKKLLDDLENVVNHYKGKLHIECDID